MSTKAKARADVAPRTAAAPAAVAGSARSGAWSFIPERPTLPALARAAQSCTACELYRHATQAVLGAGGAGVRLMLVGEQPGDKEDLAGQPFVGPAGRLLDELLEAAGICPRAGHLPNPVKHFKWEPRRQGRLPHKPTPREGPPCPPPRA